MRLLFLALSTFLLVFPFSSAYAQSEDELIAGAKKEAKVTFWSGMALDDSRLVVLNKCGHWPPYEHPEEYTNHVLNFLKPNR